MRFEKWCHHSAPPSTTTSNLPLLWDRPWLLDALHFLFRFNINLYQAPDISLNKLLGEMCAVITHYSHSDNNGASLSGVGWWISEHASFKGQLRLLKWPWMTWMHIQIGSYAQLYHTRRAKHFPFLTATQTTIQFGHSYPPNLCYIELLGKIHSPNAPIWNVEWQDQ